MALDVVGPLGRSGRIIVSDERDDGTVILLVCHDYDPTSGAVFLPPEHEHSPEPGGFPWPTEATSRLRAAAEVLPESLRHPFIMTIDTSGLPTGPQAFRSDVLLGRVSTWSPMACKRSRWMHTTPANGVGSAASSMNSWSRCHDRGRPARPEP